MSKPLRSVVTKRPRAPRKPKAKEGAFTKTFKGEWPDKPKDKLNYKDGVAAAGYTGAGAAAGAATGAAIGFNPVAGAVIGAGQYIASKLNQWRKNRLKEANSFQQAKVKADWHRDRAR